MPDEQGFESGYQHRSRWVMWFIGLGLSAIFIVTLGLSSEVISDLERQRSASSDNVQWTLTQVEVDHLTFLNALEQHLHDPDGPLPQEEGLGELRRHFDIFYSRVDTLQSSRLFANLRQDPEFAKPLASVQSFLSDAVPLIDGPDEALEAQMVPLWGEARALRPTVRELATSGLSYFAATADAVREESGRTLARLAALSAGLLLALGLVSLHLLNVNRVTRRRGDALVQTNQRMNTILSTSLDAVIVSDARGNVLEFNPAAEAIFGYSLEEAQGRPIGELIVPPQMREAHEAGMKRMEEGGERRVVGHGRVQLKGMRKSGEIFPVELALQSARADNEEIVIGFVRDISKRIAAETELITARDRALAGEKAKADFLTVMSHEIRTPLNGLLGNLSLLRNSGHSTEQGQFIHNMEISGQVLLNHVDTVLDIARFEAGKLSVKRELVDLGALMQGLVDGQSGNAAQRGNAIEWQLVGAARPLVSTDAQRLRQILLNLIGNAIKFTENGRISLELEQAEPGDDGGKPLYEFRVIDTGIGIAEADLALVFEDFHTRDASTSRSVQGAGLGLGIARRFAEAMGGEIGAESTPGEGSVFWVRLPLREARAPLHAPDAPVDEAEPVEGLDLLVVEDNEINLEVIRNMLKLDGHRVTEATDGRAGVAAAQTHRFDAILMDISMPLMDGPTATREIRSGGGPSAEVPILAVSANVLPDAVEGFREAGMNAFLGKPVKLADLRHALATVVGESIAVGGDLGESAADEAREEQLAAMREALGEEAFSRLLGRFLSQADEMAGRLAKLDPNRVDLPALAAECHKIAGSAAMFGALEMRDSLVEIETAANSGAREGLEKLAHNANAMWSGTRTRLTPLMPQD